MDLNCGGKIIVELTELVGTLPGDERNPQRKRPLLEPEPGPFASVCAGYVAIHTEVRSG